MQSRRKPRKLERGSFSTRFHKKIAHISSLLKIAHGHVSILCHASRTGQAWVNTAWCDGASFLRLAQSPGRARAWELAEAMLMPERFFQGSPRAQPACARLQPPCCARPRRQRLGPLAWRCWCSSGRAGGSWAMARRASLHPCAGAEANVCRIHWFHARTFHQPELRGPPAENCAEAASRFLTTGSGEKRNNCNTVIYNCCGHSQLGGTQRV